MIKPILAREAKQLVRESKELNRLKRRIKINKEFNCLMRDIQNEAKRGGEKLFVLFKYQETIDLIRGYDFEVTHDPEPGFRNCWTISWKEE